MRYQRVFSWAGYLIERTQAPAPQREGPVPDILIEEALKGTRSVPWALHRVAISRHYGDSLTEIKRHWTLRDLLHAHLVLDAFDKIAELQQEYTED